jgi:hypothetical protein
VPRAAGGPDFEVLAASLHTTASTLRRHLEQEGQTYQSIKDDLRRDLAVDYLCNSPSSVADIAHALGFAEHSAFHRAFRKWTGPARANTATRGQPARRAPTPAAHCIQASARAFAATPPAPPATARPPSTAGRASARRGRQQSSPPR